MDHMGWWATQFSPPKAASPAGSKSDRQNRECAASENEVAWQGPTQALPERVNASKADSIMRLRTGSSEPGRSYFGAAGRSDIGRIGSTCVACVVASSERGRTDSGSAGVGCRRESVRAPSCGSAVAGMAQRSVVRDGWLKLGGFAASTIVAGSRSVDRCDATMA